MLQKKQDELLITAEFMSKPSEFACVSRSKNHSKDYFNGIASQVYQATMQNFILFCTSHDKIHFLELRQNKIDKNNSVSIDITDVKSINVKNGFLFLEKKVFILLSDGSELALNVNFSQFKRLKTVLNLINIK